MPAFIVHLVLDEPEMMTLRGGTASFATVLVALALVTVTIPAGPATADGDAGTCSDGELPFAEEGWIAVANPTDVRASQTLAFLLSGEETPAGVSSWTNGQDAYVVHLPCVTSGAEDYCLERRSPEVDEGFPIFNRQLDEEQPDVRLEFFSPAQDAVGEHDPEVPAEDEGAFCSDAASGTDGVPAGAHYAVVYLEDGHAQGIQFDDQLWGPYTEHFEFRLT